MKRTSKPTLVAPAGSTYPRRSPLFMSSALLVAVALGAVLVRAAGTAGDPRPATANAAANKLKSHKGTFRGVQPRSDEDGVNAAGLDVLAALAAERPTDPSVWVSPYSIATALLMLTTGLGDEAAAEVLALLRVPPHDARAAVAVSAARTRLLTSASADAPSYALVGNSLWMNQRLKPAAAFRDGLRADFGATFGAVDVGDSSPINDWVSNATRGLIKKVLPPALGDDFVAALVNAIYFNGKWASPFDKAATAERQPFFHSDGARVAATVPLMHLEAVLPYAEVAGVGEVVRLAYGRCAACAADASPAFSALVVLPPVGVRPEDALAALRAVPGGVGSMLEARDGTLDLPRFTADPGVVELSDILRSLGVDAAFTPASGLGERILDPECGPMDVFVSRVLHRVVVKVDEEGTVAAAVTVIEMLSDSVGPPPFFMRVDRPFLFLVEEAGTGIVMFAGIVRDPAA